MAIRRVAIIGLSPSTHDGAPWGDPSWEKWGLPWDNGWWAQCDRLFEIHKMSNLKEEYSEDYFEKLQEMDNLYMQEAYYPNAKKYPLEETIKTTGDYLTSSIAFMLAMAIHEKVDKIGLWGVDMDLEDVYGHQRPCAEYLIGLAKGLGIEVYVPKESSLLKVPDSVGGVRYGY